MKKVIIGAALLALSSQAGAITLTLQAYNQRSSSGSLSTLKWDGCTTYTAATACINPANANISGMGITPSVMTWHWNEGTGVLVMTGTFNSVSTLGSSGSAVANTVIGDKVSNMTIDTVNDTTTASSYSCAEGTFLAGVGANGCLSISFGDDGLLQSSAVYNVGGNANCVQRTIGGDDSSTGNVRSLANTAGGGGCNAGDGAFNLWTIVNDTTNLGVGGQLIVSNGIPIANAGTAYLTFTVSAVPVPGAVWLLGSAVGLLGLVRRRIAA